MEFHTISWEAGNNIHLVVLWLRLFFLPNDKLSKNKNSILMVVIQNVTAKPMLIWWWVILASSLQLKDVADHEPLKIQ